MTEWLRNAPGKSGKTNSPGGLDLPIKTNERACFQSAIREVVFPSALGAQLGILGVFFYYSYRSMDRITYRVPLMFALVSALAWAACFFDYRWEDQVGRDTATTRTVTLLVVGIIAIFIVFRFAG